MLIDRNALSLERQSWRQRQIARDVCRQGRTINTACAKRCAGQRLTRQPRHSRQDALLVVFVDFAIADLCP